MVERRQRVLTDEDIEIISAKLKEHQKCNLGLTEEEVGFLKRFLSSWKHATSIIGSLVLVAIITGIIAIFSKGFWISLIEGASKTAK